MKNRDVNDSGLRSCTFTRLRNSNSGSLNASFSSSPDILKYSTQTLNRKKHRLSFLQDDNLSKTFSNSLNRDEMSKIEKQNLEIEEQLLKSFKSTPRNLNKNHEINTNQNIFRKEHASINFPSFSTFEFDKPSVSVATNFKSNDFLTNGLSETGSVKLVPIGVYELDSINQNSASHNNNPSRLSRSKSLVRPVKEISIQNLTSTIQNAANPRKEGFERQHRTIVNGDTTTGTTESWYKPDFSRENAINYLMQASPGSFVIRKSSSHNGSHVLVLKTDEIRDNRYSDGKSTSIRHFLIETSSNGLRFKGYMNEPEFANLDEFVEYYKKNVSILPCKLSDAFKDEFHLQYMTSVFTEVDSCLEAMKRAFDICYTNRTRIRCLPVKVTLNNNGVTFSHQSKITHLKNFYKYDEIVLCCIDPFVRALPTNHSNDQITAMCGFLTKGSGEENGCVQIFSMHHLTGIVQFINNIMNGKNSTSFH